MNKYPSPPIPMIETSIRQWLQSHPNVKRRLKKIIVIGVVASCLCLAVLYFAARWRPSFYLPAVDVAHIDYEVIENQIGELYDAIQTPGDWELTFSDEHINKWIDTDLKKVAPNMIPGYARDPRIMIRDNNALVACEYVNGNVSLVLSCVIEPMLTEKPNEVGLRLSNAKVGAVPGLTSEAMTQVWYALARGGMRIMWVKRDGNPEGVLPLPRRQMQAIDKRITIQEITLTKGHVYIAGNTDYEPITPYRAKMISDRILQAVDHLIL